MVVVSKALFDEKLPRHISCAMVHHYEPNCWTANSEMMKILLIGVTKFVFPCTLVKLAINYKKLSKKYLKEIAISHLRTTAYGCSLGMLTISSICCLYRITGPLNYYTLCFVPGVIAGLSLLVEAEDGKVFNCIAFVNLVIEAVFNNINHFRLVNMTKLKQTGLFMVCSSLLMYLLQNRKDKIDFSHFWFYVPPKNQGQTDERKCYHENDCTTYLKEGILNYAMLGFAVNFVKGLIPRMGEIIWYFYERFCYYL
ncbi:uncharacterized protein LOC109599598 isoform X2 [Aethina tumida]|uniref:uncharacterized protein LOC109599598 isoform X2 n=1 Tax=Aethina tumida TaxID=116153 RepID=UPI00096B5C94|nr:uncharacterized protein LOC109599598 isoform X2 [Aethina tumida]